MHYVIGDVHGCFDDLMNLLNKIERVDSDANFIFVGDFIDRGSRSRETLDWVLDNITENEKFQSVRGDHEQSMIDWFNDTEHKDIDWFYREYGDLYQERTEYIWQTYTDDDDKLRQIVECFRKMPLNKRIRVRFSNGNIVYYRICHSTHRDVADEREQIWCNLYEPDYWGNGKDYEITVRGHIPTFNRDFNLRGAQSDMPGFICYRRYMINVDCGRCYPRENNGINYLAAICLETLEEYYDATVNERINEYTSSNVAEWQLKMAKRFGIDDTEHINEERAKANLNDYIQKYGRSTEPSALKHIIERFHFPEDTPCILNRI